MTQFPFRLSSYFYHLDPTQIAQVPAVPPESARLMQLTSPYAISHGDFFQVPGLLDAGSLIFLNDTKVLPARIVQDFSITRNGKIRIKPCEILYLNMIEDSENTFEAMVYPGDNFPIGAIVTVGEYQLEVLDTTYQGRTFRMISHNSIMDMLLEYGSFPIPPYINASQVAQDSYQTEFAKQPGSLAAPTASLHFTKQLLESCVVQANIKIQYATLHVGIGTFKIINQEDIREHTMHGEILIVTQEIFKNIAQAKLEKRPVIAIGTTMVRYLESLLYVWPLVAQYMDFDTDVRAWWQHQSDAMVAANAETYAPSSKFRLRKWWIDGVATAETSLFIYPGYRFGIVDQIITNFHLPNSTLMPMIAAFVWIDTLKQIYEVAKNEWYRFYSFGDGMWIKNSQNTL